MFQVTIQQLRQSVPRLIAAAIAILIGAAFVTVTLLASNVLQAAANNAAAARIAQTDVYVRPGGEDELTDQQIAALRQIPGVRAVEGSTWSYQPFSNSNREVWTIALATPSDPQFNPFELTAGAWPQNPGEVALPVRTAERLSVTVGGQITAARNVKDDSLAAENLRVVGLYDDPLGSWADRGGATVMDKSDILRWRVDEDWGTNYDAAMIALDGDLTPQLRAALADAGATAIGPADVQTRAEFAAAADGGSVIVYTVFGLAFAAIALFVSALVIANTFQVLIAQRVRTLALLRCVGADKKQIRTSVLGEALGLGVVASLAGSMLGVLLARIALLFGNRIPMATPLPSSLPITTSAIMLPLVVGTVVAMAAAYVPAVAATSVAPLAALRPNDTAAEVRVASKRRGKLSVVLLAVGALIIVWAGVTGRANGGEQLSEAALMAIFGSALSFVGVLVSASMWMPPLAGLAGRLVGMSGPTAKLAVANTMRNPRRTAATASALLIGTTLVATMTTGAATARATLDQAMDVTFPVDIIAATDLQLPAAEASAIDSRVRDEIGNVAGVAAIAALPSTTVELVAPEHPLAVDTSRMAPYEIEALQAEAAAAAASLSGEQTVRAVTPALGAEVLHDGSLLAGLASGNAVVPSSAFPSVRPGDELTITGPDGAMTVIAQVTDLPESSIIVVPEHLSRIDSSPEVTRLWLALDDSADSERVMPLVEDVLADAGVSAQVEGAATQRGQMQRIINIALGAVVGLLAASVAIALIGVANTLSLSVLERQRESALLRTIGLSAEHLRRMLAVEGMLIAGVGAALGAGLGLAYGWGGAAALLGAVPARTVFVAPIGSLVATAAIALVAGYVASIVPGRTAASISPVEALAAV